MHRNRITLVVISSALAVLLLLLFQLKWLNHSKALIEEQFEQNVKMALCSAVDGAKTSFNTAPSCAVVNNKIECLQIECDSVYRSAALEESVTQALEFYGIQTQYELTIIDQDLYPSPYDVSSPYCCSLSPIINSDNQLLRITFPGKAAYVQRKMGMVTASSILIVLFVTCVFFFVNYTLWRQKRLNEIQVEYFNNMAHEFRTPLTNVSLATRLLKQQNISSKGEKYLGIIDLENIRLKEQVERILQVARFKDGKYELKKERVVLQDLLHSVIEEMNLQIKERNAEVVVEALQEPVVLVADSYHLRNAFRNILDNALKYNTEVPKISIRLSLSAEGVTILFADNGIGISAQSQGKIFERFTRVSEHSQKNNKGYGLGLNYVKNIVARHQGVVEIISELNKGSHFRLFFPVTR